MIHSLIGVLMSLDNKIEVTVFIATTAEKKREKSIRNAIDSALTQIGSQLVVIINGNKFEPSLKAELEILSDIDCHYLSLGDFPEAVRYARTIVNTKYFSFLDDDDELTKDSIGKRLSIIRESEDIDVVIGNGYRKGDDNVKTLVLDAQKIDMFHQDPLLALFQRRGNWLASCSGLYRTSSITQKYFDDYAKYAEWSYLAVKIACFNKVKLVDTPCFIINESGESMSKSLVYYESQYHYLFKLLALGLPPQIDSIIKIKKVNMEHQLSVLFLENGERLKAWYYHLLSLSSFHGIQQYIFYTRYFFFQKRK